MSYALLLVAALVTSPPQIDGMATHQGAQVQEPDRRELPNSRHTSDVLDVMLISPIGAQIGGSGIDLFDPVRVSVHGRSVTGLRYFWGGVDITDPARPGQPLVDMPVGAWEHLVLHTLWTERPGVTFVTPTQLHAAQPLRARVVVQGSASQGDVGGGLWWPNSWFDRNDARAYGAPDARRSLTQAREGELSMLVPLKHGTLFVLGERMEHGHRYLTTTGPERLTRDTALVAFSREVAGWPVDVRGLYQQRHRDQDGGSLRFDDSEVQVQTGRGWLLQAETEGLISPEARLRLALGAGGRSDVAQGFLGAGYSQDISDTWLRLGRPQGAETLNRWQLGAEARLSFLSDAKLLWRDEERLAQGMDPALHLLASARVARWHRAPQDEALRIGERLGPQGITMAVREGAQDGAITQHQLRGGVESHWPLGGPGRALDVSGGVDLSGVSDGSGLLTQAVGPSAGAMVQWRSGFGLDTFLMVRREPEAITAQVGDFLGAIGPRGSVYAWKDANADAVPDAEEAGERLGGFGAPVHRAEAHLRRPGHTQVALGIKSPPFAGLRVGLRGVGHMLHDRYTVVGQSAAPSTPKAFHDPGGDGRGEVRSPQGGQDLVVTQEPRVPDRYVLTNDGQPSYYLGLEAEVRVEPHPRFFASVLGATYMSRSNAPFGSFADRNDPGIISEASGTANNRLNSYGRTDSDRAFALKILAGVRPLPGLSWGLAARYRDGQPFTRIVVDESLPQGPTALMAVARGKPRHTALMVWDMRLRYETSVLRPLGLTVIGDVYNLLNSATEIAEDPRTGPTFRRALEAIPGRAVWVGLALGFLP